MTIHTLAKLSSLGAAPGTNLLPCLSHPGLATETDTERLSKAWENHAETDCGTRISLRLTTCATDCKCVYSVYIVYK